MRLDKSLDAFLPLVPWGWEQGRVFPLRADSAKVPNLGLAKRLDPRHLWPPLLEPCIHTHSPMPSYDGVGCSAYRSYSKEGGIFALFAPFGYSVRIKQLHMTVRLCNRMQP